MMAYESCHFPVAFSPHAVSSSECRVPRDIYPMPMNASCRLGPAAASLSRSVRRRLAKPANFESDSLFTLQALNRTFLGSGPLLDHATLSNKYKADRLPASIPSNDHNHVHPHSAAQTQVSHHVSSCISSLGPPPPLEELSPAGALRELCGAVSGYDSAPKNSHPASYNPDCLSLPDSNQQPVPLESLWDHSQAVLSLIASPKTKSCLKLRQQ